IFTTQVYIPAVIPEQIPLDLQRLIQKTGLDSKVQLGGYFPGNVRIGVSIDSVSIIVIGEGGAPAIRSALLECDVGQIKETILSLSYGIVPHRSISSLELERINSFPNWSPKFLHGQNPSTANREEKTKSTVSAKFLGTIVTVGKFQEIFGIVIIGHPSRNSHISFW